MEQTNDIDQYYNNEYIEVKTPVHEQGKMENLDILEYMTTIQE